ncbi:MAG: DUF1064 domain-containing protein [Planctomycetaceae bacterium]|nr:DUF1064 domain-containing protein [Planctomycetaceae bacterium]
MNRTEARFAERLLSLKAAGEILGYHYEAVKLCITPGLPGKRQATYYTPDFLVLRADLELELIDVKGSAGWEDTARVKIKAAADRFPEFHWVGYTLTRSGSWEREEFN